MSTLDERIARDCERSGVPFFIEDDAVLDRLAAMLADTMADWAREGRADWTGEDADHARPA